MPANLAMGLSNGEANLALVRALVLGFAAALGLDALEADDLDTALSEAFKNAVWHAYDGAEGPVEIELEAAEGAVNATVRDEGIGIRPHLGEARAHHVGIGLPLIHVRARRVIYTNREGGGTELRMEFEMPSVRPLAGPSLPGMHVRAGGEHDARLGSEEHMQGGADTVQLALALAPAAALAPAVLPRLLATLALGAGMGAEAGAELQDLVRDLSRCTRDPPGGEALLLSGAAGERSSLQLRLDGLDAASAEAIATRAHAALGADALIELSIGASADAGVWREGAGERTASPREPGALTLRVSERGSTAGSPA